jgi:hypothetical protein
VTYPYIVAEDSPLAASTGSLAGRSYGWMGHERASVESDGRAADMITFVNGSYAYLGLPPFGFPTCTSTGHRCYRYSYDASTGVFQVGPDVVGRLVGDALHTDGFVVPDYEDGEQFAPDTLEDPLVFAARGTRLEGHWLYHSEEYPNGLITEDVTFHRNGTYALTTEVYPKRRHFTGSYRITRRGKITFTAKRKLLALGTIAFPSEDGTKAKPKEDGLWLVLSGTKGKSGDGNLLRPVKKKH